MRHGYDDGNGTADAGGDNGEGNGDMLSWWMTITMSPSSPVTSLLWPLPLSSSLWPLSSLWMKTVGYNENKASKDAHPSWGLIRVGIQQSVTKIYSIHQQFVCKCVKTVQPIRGQEPACVIWYSVQDAPTGGLVMPSCLSWNSILICVTMFRFRFRFTSFI